MSLPVGCKKTVRDGGHVINKTIKYTRVFVTMLGRSNVCMCIKECEWLRLTLSQ